MTTNTKRLQDYLNAIDTRDRATIVDTYADDVEIRAPGTELDGRAAAAAWIDVFLRAFPDLHHEVRNVVEADDQVCAEVNFTGTHTGPLASPGGDIAATGEIVSLDYAVVLRFAGEQLQSEHVYFDQAAFLTQLGLRPT